MRGKGDAQREEAGQSPKGKLDCWQQRVIVVHEKGLWLSEWNIQGSVKGYQCNNGVIRASDMRQQYLINHLMKWQIPDHRLAD